MTDKTRTIIWVIEDIDAVLSTDASPQSILDTMVREGNSYKLALRQRSLDDDHGVFKALTALSLID